MADRASCEERRSYRRSEASHGKVHHDDDAEVHGIDSELLDGRKEDRRRDEDQRGNVHEAAEYQEKHVDHHQQHELVVRDGEHEVRDHRRYLQIAHQVAERVGARDDGEDHGQRLEGSLEDPPDLGDLH